MINFDKKYFETKLFIHLKNNNFTNYFKHIKYLTEFFEIYKRIEIQRLIINYKLSKLKKNIYFNCYKYEMLINNKYLYELVILKNYLIDEMFKNKNLYLTLIMI